VGPGVPGCEGGASAAGCCDCCGVAEAILCWALRRFSKGFRDKVASGKEEESAGGGAGGGRSWHQERSATTAQNKRKRKSSLRPRGFPEFGAHVERDIDSMHLRAVGSRDPRP